jgi:branched-chain amino acid transport system ATP-binding protein
MPTTAVPGGQPSADGAPLLRIVDLTVAFGGLVALDGVSFDVGRGRIVGLIGPNGAGKTTLFNCLSRICPTVRGDMVYDGRSLRHAASHDVAGLGIARTFQNLALFGSLSVLDNVLLGGHCRTRAGFAASALRLGTVAREERQLRAHAHRLLELLELDGRAATPVTALPFGSRKRVELARALASRPRLLLLDEPACGLNHEETVALAALIRRIRSDLDLTVLLVEHRMPLVMGLSDRVVVLDFGRKIAEGEPSAVQRHPAVVRAYLGEGESAGETAGELAV